MYYLGLSRLQRPVLVAGKDRRRTKGWEAAQARIPRDREGCRGREAQVQARDDRGHAGRARPPLCRGGGSADAWLPQRAHAPAARSRAGLGRRAPSPRAGGWPRERQGQSLCFPARKAILCH